ncbi:hypothetical protein MUP37_04210, partial [Candidatus Bathyarchaeota archaeon]|nr:hypothetical protein [Candidatus Bathyarchaeota archaeon]
GDSATAVKLAETRALRACISWCPDFRSIIRLMIEAAENTRTPIVTALQKSCPEMMNRRPITARAVKQAPIVFSNWIIHYAQTETSYSKPSKDRDYCN